MKSNNLFVKIVIKRIEAIEKGIEKAIAERDIKEKNHLLSMLSINNNVLNSLQKSS